MRSAIVIGAGIVGLAATKALAEKGYKVTVLERSGKAVGASIRNFGMVWPIGQPDGELYERAMRSKSIWQQVCMDANIWHDPVGSIHLAYDQDELNVLSELAEKYQHRGYTILSADKTKIKSPAANVNGLKGSLYSSTEIIVDPREALQKLPLWLTEKYKVQYIWGKAVTDVSYPSVYAGRDEFEADVIFVCSGADFQTLYPEIYADGHVTSCKLQMMRMEAQPANWRIGPAVCGGLSLMHYESFRAASSWQELRKRYERELPEYLKFGIHVMAAQNQFGEITIGDSHEYGATVDPFDKQFINDLILDYLDKLVRLKNPRIIESWNGVYAKLTNGDSELVISPEQGVTIINGLGGAGMTLSFGLCEQVVSLTGIPNSK
ncbi:MAG: TIGR03364 family FAD-dependent oxidoreductase [Chitinophagaceae bacterium]|nr:TIGR03364 family FAD-dependent oxidoreductase [Chitinophagaceae bacterium]